MNKRIVFTILILLSFFCLLISGGTFLNVKNISIKYIYYLHTSIWQLVSFILILVPVFFVLKEEKITNSINIKPAGIFERFIALIIDVYTGLIIILTPFVFLLILLEYIYSGNFHWHIERQVGMGYDSFLKIGVIVVMISLLILLAYPLSKQRVTIGQYICGIAINETKRITLIKSILRLILGYFGLCCFFISLFIALKDDKKRMLHDKVFGTIPVRIKK